MKLAILNPKAVSDVYSNGGKPFPTSSDRFANSRTNRPKISKINTLIFHKNLKLGL